jgi:hypothetical protein
LREAALFFDNLKNRNKETWKLMKTGTEPEAAGCPSRCGRRRAEEALKWEKAGCERAIDPPLPALARLNRRKWLISRI